MPLTKQKPNATERDTEPADIFAWYLFWAAWIMYLVSLLLPAIRIDFAGNLQILRGWEVLYYVFTGVLVAPILMIYLYANFIFIVSLLEMRVSEIERAFFRLNLIISMAVTWHAQRMVDEALIGYYTWTVSFTLITIAFWLPETRTKLR